MSTEQDNFAEEYSTTGDRTTPPLGQEQLTDSRSASSNRVQDPISPAQWRSGSFEGQYVLANGFISSKDGVWKLIADGTAIGIIFVPPPPGDATQFLNGSAVPAWSKPFNGGGVYSCPQNNAQGLVIPIGKKYYADTSGANGVITEADSGDVMTSAGTLHNLVVVCFSGAGNPMLCTLFKNGIATPIHVTVTSTGVFSDLLSSTTTNVGDRITLETDNTVGASVAGIYFAYENT